jgi:WD40 repeat protein
MRRCALFFVLLVCGCNRPAAGPGFVPVGPSAPPTNAGLDLTAVPKVQPKVKFKLPGERYSQHPLQISTDGQRLATVSSDGKGKFNTQIWDLSGEPKVIAEFEGFVVALSPSGKLVFIQSSGFGTVYEVASKKSVAKLPNFVSHGAFRDDTLLASTQRSHDFPHPQKGKITLWDIAKNADAGSFEIPDDRFDDAYPAKDGKEFWLFMSANRFEVECYDIEGKKLARTIKPEADDPAKPYTSAGIYHTIAPDSSVFTADVSKLHIYDAETGKIVGNLPEGLWGTAFGLQLGKNRYLAHASDETAEKAHLTKTDFVVYDWKAKTPVAILTGHSAGEEEPITVTSADGKTLISITKKGEGLLFDLSSVK